VNTNKIHIIQKTDDYEPEFMYVGLCIHMCYYLHGLLVCAVHMRIYVNTHVTTCTDHAQSAVSEPGAHTLGSSQTSS